MESDREGGGKRGWWEQGGRGAWGGSGGEGEEEESYFREISREDGVKEEGASLHEKLLGFGEIITLQEDTCIGHGDNLACSQKSGVQNVQKRSHKQSGLFTKRLGEQQ